MHGFNHVKQIIRGREFDVLEVDLIGWDSMRRGVKLCFQKLYNLKKKKLLIKQFISSSKLGLRKRILLVYKLVKFNEIQR